MEKKIICLLLFCLLVPSITLFASDWVHVRDGRYGGDGDPFHTYVDISTVERNGNTLIYWYKAVSDPNGQLSYTRIHKYEVDLTNSPFRCRVLEQYVYDSNNKEKSSQLIPTPWQDNICDEDEINAALKSLKGSHPRPTP